MTVEEILSETDYEVLTGEHGKTTVREVSEVLGIPHTHVLKTMVLQNKYSRRTVACCFTGGSKVDRRQLVELDEGGTKAWRFIPNVDLLRVSGYPEGAVPPIGLSDEITAIFVDPRVFKKPFVIFPQGDGVHYLKCSPEVLYKDRRVKKRVISMG